MNLVQMLAEARTALHKLEIGQAAVEVMVDGYLVRYQRADVYKLEAYIARLEDDIRRQATGDRRRAGGIGVIFR